MITHSIVTGKVSKKDNKQVGELAEQYFHTMEDPEQMPKDELNPKFFSKFSLAPNIIKNGKEVIGHTFILPCNKKAMNKFLKKEINERQLFYIIRDEIKENEYDSLYWVSAQIIPKYQRKGIATEGLIIQIKNYEKKYNKKMNLFTWIISEEGEKLRQKLERELNRKIKFR